MTGGSAIGNSKVPTTGAQRTTGYTFLLAVVLIALFANAAPARVLDVNTTAADPSRAGESIDLELATIAMGVSASSTTLATAHGTVGEPIELTGVDTPIRRPVQLRVTLGESAFYRVLSRQELEEGPIELRIRSVGDPEGVEVTRNMLQVQPIRGRLMVREVQVLNNASDRYAPAGSYRVDLPPGATRLNLKAGFGGEEDIRRVDDGFEYGLMIPPGRTVLAFYYFIQTDARTYEMTREVTAPTRQYMVTLPAVEELSVSGKNLGRNQGQPGPQGESTLQFSGRDLSPGTVVGVQFEGLQAIEGMDGMQPPGSGERASSNGESPTGSRSNRTSRPTSVSTTSWPLILGIALSVLVFVGSYGYVQYRVSGAGGGARKDSFLVDEIARLDQEYEDGAIDEPFYRRTRRRWKKALEESMDEPTGT